MTDNALCRNDLINPQSLRCPPHSSPITTTDMTTPNAGPASTSQHDGELASFKFDDILPSSHALLPPSDASQPSVAFEPDFGLVLSVPLYPSATTTTALPPLAGPSSLKTPTSDANKASGSKRKQDSEDVDSASQAGENSIERKKPKRESLDDGAYSFMAPGHMSDVAGSDRTVNVCDGRANSTFADFESRNLNVGGQDYSALRMSQTIRSSIRPSRHHLSQTPLHLSQQFL
jgi:hypothetical protein